MYNKECILIIYKCNLFEGNTEVKMYYYLIVIAIILLDQFTKYFAITHVKNVVTIPIIENIFHLTYAENTGAAFSILSNKIPLLTIVTSIFIICLLIYMSKMIIEKKGFQWMTLALTFVIGGAIGNLIDRIRLAYVVDFFEFRFIQFAIFNVADTFIVVGSILLIICILLEEKA